MHLSSISVVIPCYNYARYVGQAVDSVLAQRYPALDLVVVNDGSTDNSLAVIREHAPNAKIIDQHNQGQVAACNAGFAASTGEVVIFLDADDLLEPGALSRVAEVWSPRLAKVQSDLKIIDAEGRDLGRLFAHFGPDYTVERVREDFSRGGTYRWPVTVGNAYSRWFVALLFPQSFPGPVDGYLNTLAPLYGDVLTLPHVLGRYRLHGTNMSASARGASGLVEQIAVRRTELAELRRHANMRGVQLPEVDPLDHELPFLNFRLVALKLGMSYVGGETDRVPALLRKAMAQLWHEGLPLKITAAHALWFVAVAIMPRQFVSTLVKLRFDRAQWKQAWKQRLLHIGA